MSTYPERFLGRLKGLKLLPDSGQYSARWEARCPAHNDRTPSLSISLARKGYLLVHCHAGCPTEAVMSAVGLEMSDLYPPSASPSKNNAPEKHSPNTDPAKSESAKSTISNQNSRPKTKNGRFGEITGTYDYYDAEGTLLYQVVRFAPKKFRQRRPNPKGGWIWSMEGVGRVPYLLPEMLEAIGEGHPILIVEGEKDVETALRMRSELEDFSGRSFSATTAPGGAGKWRPSFSRFFKGAHVWIVPDIDEAGFDHARQVAKRLRGVAESIKVLRLPSTTRHFDLSDWAAQRKTGADLLHLADQSPYLLSRAHPTHAVGFEAVPGPSAPLEEIQEYIVSAGSVRSGKASVDTSTGESPPEEVSAEDASSGEDAHIPSPDQQDEQPTSTGKPSKWERIGARSSEWEGIGVEVTEGLRPTEEILSGLDGIVTKNRNGEVGFCLLPSDPEVSDPDAYTSEDCIPQDFTSASGPDEQTAHPEGDDPTEEAVLSEETGPFEETSSPVETDPPDSTEVNSPKPRAAKTESITEAAETHISRENGSRENGSSDHGPLENGSVAVPSRQNGTSRSSNTGLSESRSSSESSFSSETREVIRLLEEEGAEVISTGGAFYLVFPFLPSTESGFHEQFEEAHYAASSGKAYRLDSPLVVPLLLRLAYDRKGWIPSPEVCRAALFFLTPAVPSAAHVSARVAAGNGALYIDAGENTILEVKPSGWQARSSAPALFLRSEHSCPLPTPEKSGSLTGFRQLLQIEADAAWVGIRGWLLGALCPTGPVPPLLLEGDDPWRLARLARQLASVLDPRSPVPLNRFQSLLSAGRGLSPARAERDNWSAPLDPTNSNQELSSGICPFVTCLPVPSLKDRNPIWPGPTGGQAALQENGSGPSATELRGWDATARPLATRVILVGPGAALPVELRNELLTVRPAFQGGLSSAAFREPAAHKANEGRPPECHARSEAFGVLLAGAAEGLNHAGKPPHPEEAVKSQYTPFLTWVAAAEAGLSPAALGSGLSGPSSRPFMDVWRAGRRPFGLFRRLLRALRRWMR